MKTVYVDFDGTLVDSNSFHYLYFIRRQRLQNSRGITDLIAYGLCLVLFPVFILAHLFSAKLRDRLTYAFYWGISEQEMVHYSTLFWKLHPHLLYKRTSEFLRQKKQENYSIVIVSGSIYEIVQSAVKAWDLNECIDEIISARMEAIDGILTGRMKQGPMVEDNKVLAIQDFEQKNLPEERICISDSYSDRLMLELGHKKVLIKPNAKLRQLAQDQSWEIWTFA
jgi:phosphoserine phosphatase